jgi:hypothetical protein
MRHALWITLLAFPFYAPLCPAQTLSSHPAFFADPLLAVDPAAGDLVLGQTTLRSAMRIFASELQDSVRVPLAHGSNPLTLPAGSTIGGPASAPDARYKLNIGVGRYTLYFDKNERLIAVDASLQSLPRLIRREDLVARYATLRSSRRSSSLDNLEAVIGPCLLMSAWAWDGNGAVNNGSRLPPGSIIGFGYRYTCSTKPAAQSALLSDLPYKRLTPPA